MKVDTLISDNGIDANSKIAVGFSGGCDSSALLHALVQMRNKIGFQLAAIHVNHSLRGAESDSDQQFSEGVCKDYNVKLYTFRVDVAGEAKKTGESIELCARRMRYAAFGELIDKGYTIATAHTMSDNAETVLFNMARGSGIKGMCGIPKIRNGYIRPLLERTRADTENYCRENGIKYVTDSTNLCDDYTRNYIRHNIVSKFKKINPTFESAVLSMSGQLRDIDVMIDRMARDLLKSGKLSNGYNCEILKQAEKPVLSRAVRIAAEDATGLKIDSQKTECVCSVIAGGGRTQLGKGWFAAGGKILRFYRESECSDFQTEIKIGKNETPEYYVEINTEKAQCVHNLLMLNAIDCDKINGSMVLRNRREGDKIKLRGRPNKLLRRLMNEVSIPAERRDSVPVIADSTGVIFVCGIGADERVAVDENTKDVIIITSEGKNNA